MNTRFSPRLRRPAPSGTAPETDPVLLPPERPVEQPAPGTHGLRTMLLAAAGGVGLGVVSWFGVLPAVTGGDPRAEALPPSSMAVLADAAPTAPAVDAAEPGSLAPPPGAPAPPPGGPADAAGDPEEQPAPGGPEPAPSPRDPFAPLAEDAERPAPTPEPVAVVPDPTSTAAAAGTTPSTAGASPAPSASAGRPVAGSVEFTGEPVTFRLLASTTGTAQQPGTVRATLDGLVVELAAGDSVAALTLLAAGEPCAAFQLGTTPFVLCEGQERTLSFG